MRCIKYLLLCEVVEATILVASVVTAAADPADLEVIEYTQASRPVIRKSQS